MKTSQLMLYREIIAFCSQIHTKHINTLFGKNVEFLWYILLYLGFKGLNIYSSVMVCPRSLYEACRECSAMWQESRIISHTSLGGACRGTLVVRRNSTGCADKYVRVLQLRGVTIKCSLSAAVTGTNKEVHTEFCSNKEVHIDFCSNEE